MSSLCNQLVATVEFCQTNFISEYSIDKLLQAWGMKKEIPTLTPKFLNSLISFLRKLPLACFNNSAVNVGKTIEQIRKIMLENTPSYEEETARMDKELNIIRAKRQVISYI